MNYEELRQLKAYVAREITLTPDNIEEMTLKIPNLIGKFLGRYVDERRLLKELKAEVSTAYHTSYHKHKFDFNYKLDTKSEIESYVFADEDYRAKKLAYDTQEVCTEYIGSVVEMLQKMNFNISYYLDFQKLKLGIVR